MPVVLGIHNGHHAACAIVRDGVVVAAIEQERITRLKHDGQEGLSNRLPVSQCLHSASTSIDDIDLIVSSYQALGPGGVGFNRPLVEPDFNLFDPCDNRHVVVSHHYAHALCALGTSGFRNAAALVCDLAGSYTVDGSDFACSFREFQSHASNLKFASTMRTECLSIYEADERELILKHREFCVPHNSPEVFVCSVGSLYDNVARVVFGQENAHGQLMALASVLPAEDCEVTVDDLIECPQLGIVRFKNDWQHRVIHRKRQLEYAPLAAVVQQATQVALLQHVQRARLLTSSRQLVAAGGVFLNIAANSEIAASGLFDQFHVPSAPHDAGIAIGCAFHGWRVLAAQRGLEAVTCERKSSDRLGPTYRRRCVDDALRAREDLVEVLGDVGPREVADLLVAGRIVARWAGRSEFGPRALGGRSLLATPLRLESKDQLNRIKGRQPWRPVAPVVPREQMGQFFSGPEDSPYMNFVHRLHERHRKELVALAHPDDSTRTQTLCREDDPFLFSVLVAFGEITGYPILVNTSFNGLGEPIVETPRDALGFFLAQEDIDLLLLEDQLVERTSEPSLDGTYLPPNVTVVILRPPPTGRVILLRDGVSLEIARSTLTILECSPNGVEASTLTPTVRDEITRALRRGLLARTET